MILAVPLQVHVIITYGIFAFILENRNLNFKLGQHAWGPPCRVFAIRLVVGLFEKTMLVGTIFHISLTEVTVLAEVVTEDSSRPAERTVTSAGIPECLGGLLHVETVALGGILRAARWA